MHTDWFSLAILTTLLASVVEILPKTALKDNVSPIAFTAFSQILIGIFAYFASFFLDSKIIIFPLNNRVYVLAALAIILLSIGKAIYYFILKRLPMTEVNILTSAEVFWVFLGGIILLNEILTTKKVFAVSLMLLGIIIFYYNKNTSIRFSKMQIILFFSFITFGITSSLNRFMMSYFSPAGYLAITRVGCGLLIAIFTLKKMPSIVLLLKNNGGIILTFALLETIDNLLFLYALRLGGEISRVGPIIYSSIILKWVFSVTFLKERTYLLKSLISTICIFLGIILLK